MSKSANVNAFKLAKILCNEYGFNQTGRKGSHIKLEGVVDHIPRTVTIDIKYKELSLNNFLSVVRQSGIDKNELLRLL